jgi:hypothetical protein
MSLMPHLQVSGLLCNPKIFNLKFCSCWPMLSENREMPAVQVLRIEANAAYDGRRDSQL